MRGETFRACERCDTGLVVGRSGMWSHCRVCGLRRSTITEPGTLLEEKRDELLRIARAQYVATVSPPESEFTSLHHEAAVALRSWREWAAQIYDPMTVDGPDPTDDEMRTAIARRLRRLRP